MHVHAVMEHWHSFCEHSICTAAAARSARSSRSAGEATHPLLVLLLVLVAHGHDGALLLLQAGQLARQLLLLIGQLRTQGWQQ